MSAARGLPVVHVTERELRIVDCALAVAELFDAGQGAHWTFRDALLALSHACREHANLPLMGLRVAPPDVAPDATKKGVESMNRDAHGIAESSGAAGAQKREVSHNSSHRSGGSARSAHSFRNVIEGQQGLVCEWCGVKHIDTADGAWGRITKEQEAAPLVSDVCPRAPTEAAPSVVVTEEDLKRLRDAQLRAYGGAGSLTAREAAELVREIDTLHVKLAESHARERRLMGLVTDMTTAARRAIELVDKGDLG